jgi:hypothetical protein
MSSARRRRSRGPTNDAGVPEFFTDRGLGTRVVEALRREGWTVHAMRELYPSSDRRRSDRFQDENWIPTVTERGYVILSKDGFRWTHERLAIAECRARVFMIPNASLRAEYMVERFVTQRHDIWARCNDPGPFLYAVHPTSLQLITLPDA